MPLQRRALSLRSGEHGILGKRPKSDSVLHRERSSKGANKEAKGWEHSTSLGSTTLSPKP